MIREFMYTSIYENCKLYGPYYRPDGRRHVVLIFKNGKRKTVSYPKYIMEKHLNHYLDINETVDHIDKDINNNSISNLQILGRGNHCSLDHIRRKPVKTKCAWCSKEFIISGKSLNDRKNRNNKPFSGYFCSKRCIGYYGSNIQNKNITHFIADEPKPEYYYTKKGRVVERYTHRV